jgi:hypothetical protein
MSSGKSTGKYTEFSATISGFIGAGPEYWALPIPAVRSGAASIQTGSSRVHGTVP